VIWLVSKFHFPVCPLDKTVSRAPRHNVMFGNWSKMKQFLTRSTIKWLQCACASTVKFQSSFNSCIWSYCYTRYVQYTRYVIYSIFTKIRANMTIYGKQCTMHNAQCTMNNEQCVIDKRIKCKIIASKLVSLGWQCVWKVSM
jgi:hypothetical protein